MDEIIKNLITLSYNKELDDKDVSDSILARSKTTGKRYSKKLLIAHYIKNSVNGIKVDKLTNDKVLKALQIKPRRTASGVATITVMTKPFKCLSDCVYCPNDPAMPKSYLSDEPVCQRAQALYFDPYLQVTSRLRALKQMGHPTDKIEIIVLGGTFCDYSKGYQVWFINGIFQALNDSDFETDNNCDFDSDFKIIPNSAVAEKRIKNINKFYSDFGLSNDKKVIEKSISDTLRLFLEIEKYQIATIDELILRQKKNESNKYKIVGLVIETRPDTITVDNLLHIRELGCTKVQMGVQSLQENVLKMNNRHTPISVISNAHNLLHIFGFKIHDHFMLNLYGSDTENDKKDYLKLVSDKGFIPDEIKLYPCVLVKNTMLEKLFLANKWSPYSYDELVNVLSFDLINTPRFIRISRMIRDISAHDILVGNKKSNLRQIVEKNPDVKCSKEIRFREIGIKNFEFNDLTLKTSEYETEMTKEYFIEWVDKNDNIAGFLRLSLPFYTKIISSFRRDKLPFFEGEAMIREVHIYGKTASIQKNNQTNQILAQHQGLGKKIIAKACDIAIENGFSKLNVISSIGTRNYYRSLGFIDKKYYQQKMLV